jgi:hypothetical protein
MSKRVVLWSLSILIVALFAGCSNSPSEPHGSVELRLVLTQESVSPSGQLDWTLALNNSSSETVRYQFGSGCQFNFKVYQGAELIWDDRSRQICTFAITSIILKPGESRFCRGTWNVRDAGGTVTPGTYEARGELQTEPTVQSQAVSFRVEG